MLGPQKSRFFPGAVKIATAAAENRAILLHSGADRKSRISKKTSKPSCTQLIRCNNIWPSMCLVRRLGLSKCHWVARIAASQSQMVKLRDFPNENAHRQKFWQRTASPFPCCEASRFASPSISVVLSFHVASLLITPPPPGERERENKITKLICECKRSSALHHWHRVVSHRIATRIPRYEPLRLGSQVTLPVLMHILLPRVARRWQASDLLPSAVSWILRTHGEIDREDYFGNFSVALAHATLECWAGRYHVVSNAHFSTWQDLEGTYIWCNLDGFKSQFPIASRTRIANFESQVRLHQDSASANSTKGATRPPCNHLSRHLTISVETLGWPPSSSRIGKGM